MDFFYSLRFRLTVLCLLTIAIPQSILMFFMPFYYRDMISEETKALTESNISSLKKNIDIYLDDLERITLSPYLTEEYTNALIFRAEENYSQSQQYDLFKTNQTISSMLSNSLLNTRKDIVCTLYSTSDDFGYLMTKDGLVTPQPDFKFTQQEWYKEAVAADGKAVFTNVHAQDYYPTPQKNRVFSVARLINNPYQHKKPLGVIMADADTVILGQILGDAKFNVSSIVAVLDSDNNLIYSNHPISISALDQIKTNENTIYENKEQYVTVSKKLDRVNWKMVVLLSNSEIKSKLRFVYLISFLLAIAVSVFVLFLFSILSRLITNPFNKIMRFVKQLEKGDLKSRINIEGRDEISKLAEALDNMAYRLDDLIDREYKAALSKRNAEFYALQSQVSPHFLYNTLNGFLGLNRLGKHETLEKSITALTGLLRYTLDQKDLTTVSEELLFLERYCSIQKLRFEDRLEYNICCDSVVAIYKIPKLILQPLIENSIIHGVEPLDRVGTIQVIAGLTCDSGVPYLQISITDNGAGFNHESLSEDEDAGVGLANVKERLSLLFPESIFLVSSKPGEGTQVIIKIPQKDVV